MRLTLRSSSKIPLHLKRGIAALVGGIFNVWESGVQVNRFARLKSWADLKEKSIGSCLSDM